jgi:hypothetical protein
LGLLERLLGGTQGLKQSIPSQLSTIELYLQPIKDPSSSFFFFFLLFFGGREGKPGHALSLEPNGPPVHSDLVFFGDGVSRIISPGWIQTVTLLISASQVARIIGVSHRLLVASLFFETETCCVAQIGFDSLIFLLNLPSAGITGVHHHPWQEETFIVFA